MLDVIACLRSGLRSIEYGREMERKVTGPRIEQAERDARSLAVMNETLSEQLDRHIGEN